MLFLQVSGVGDLICTHLSTPLAPPPLYGKTLLYRTEGEMDVTSSPAAFLTCKWNLRLRSNSALCQSDFHHGCLIQKVNLSLDHRL